MFRGSIIFSGFAIFCLFIMLPSAVEAGTTYNVYTDELPSWAQYASNVMFDATNAWEDDNPGLEFFVATTPTEADFRVQWVKEFGVEHVGYAYGNRFVEVGLGDSDCTGRWQPYSADYVTNIMMHEIGHILGLSHSTDPQDIMYPVALNKEYGLVEHEFTLTENYAQFIEFCTYKDITSINFQATIDDPQYGFDAYVVPSKESFDDWSDGSPFEFYPDEQCFGKGFRAFGGTCEGVPRGSGLLVIMGDTLTDPLTKLTVNVEEISSTSTTAKSISIPTPTPKPTPTPTPTPTPAPAPTGFGTLVVDQDEFVLSYSQNQLVKVHGEAFNINRGDRIELLFTLPDGTTHGNKVVPTKDGYFESFLNLDRNSPKGNYEILASAYGKIIGIVHFDVLAQESDTASTPEINVEPDPIPVDETPNLPKDSDNDGILDNSDKCTLEPETINGYQDHDGCPDSKPVTNDWEQKSKKIKNSVESKLDSLKPGITTAENSLNEAEFSSSGAQTELEIAQAKIGVAKKYLNDSEINQKEGQTLISDLRFEDSYHKFQNSLDNAEKIDAFLLEITEHLSNAESLESAYLEGTKQNDEKTCFLFWCW